MAQKGWTIEEFAEKYEYNPEYVRAMCRKQTDNKGTVLKLPPNFVSFKRGGRWVIKRIKRSPPGAEKEKQKQRSVS